MSVRRVLRVGAVVAATLLPVLVSPTAAHAQAPINDAFANATAIGALPFSDTVDMTESTVEPGERGDCNTAFTGRTVWYTVTPSVDQFLKFTASGITVAVAYSGSGGFFFLTNVAESCRGGPDTQLFFQARANTTYYFQLGSWSPGTVAVELTALPNLANDNFADATEITALPFEESLDLGAGTVEPGEPSVCGHQLDATAWYEFSPTTAGPTDVTSFFPDVVSVYTGSSLDQLNPVVGCEHGTTDVQRRGRHDLLHPSGRTAAGP